MTVLIFFFCFVNIFTIGESTSKQKVVSATVVGAREVDATDASATKVGSTDVRSTYLSTSASASGDQARLSKNDCSNGSVPSGTFRNIDIKSGVRTENEGKHVNVTCIMLAKPPECKNMINEFAKSTQLYIITDGGTSDQMIEYDQKKIDIIGDENAEITFTFPLIHQKHHKKSYFCKSSNDKSLVLESENLHFPAINQKWTFFMKPTAIITEIGATLQLTCHTNHTDALDQIVWVMMKNGADAYSDILSQDDYSYGTINISRVQNASVLTLKQNEAWMGKFKCLADSMHSDPPYAEASVTIKPKDKRVVQGTSIACSTLAAIVLLVIVTLIIRKKALQKKIEISTMLMDVQEAHANSQPIDEKNCYSTEGSNLGEGSLGSESLSVTFNRITRMWESWQKERSKLTIKSELGEGNFGIVFLGILEDVNMQGSQVAVKTIKTSQLNKQAITEFEKEISIMTSLHHENIVSLIGLCTDMVPLYIIMEYMENGQLNKFLMDKAPNKLEDASLTTLYDLLHIGRQPCSAMAYLTNKNIVHRDISARNCLVGKNLIVKLADFGLSRDTAAVGGKNYYKKDSDMVPVKWMAPEALKYGKYTTFNDIWACGVLLWEIFSFGAIPYQGYSNQQVLVFVDKGGRLDKPYNCPETIWRQICMCWMQTPEDRISIDSLFKMLSGELDSLSPNESFTLNVE